MAGFLTFLPRWRARRACTPPSKAAAFVCLKLLKCFVRFVQCLLRVLFDQPQFVVKMIRRSFNRWAMSVRFGRTSAPAPAPASGTPLHETHLSEPQAKLARNAALALLQTYRCARTRRRTAWRSTVPATTIPATCVVGIMATLLLLSALPAPRHAAVARRW